MNRSHQLCAATPSAASSQATFRQDTATGQTFASYLLALLDSWQHLGRSRRHLLELDDHLLKDIGLTRCQVGAEANKPFWRV